MFRKFIEAERLPFSAPKLPAGEIKAILSEVGKQFDASLDSDFLLQFLTKGIEKLNELETL